MLTHTWNQKPSLTYSSEKLALPVQTKAMDKLISSFLFSKWRFQPGSLYHLPVLLAPAFCGDSCRKEKGHFYSGFSWWLLSGSQDLGRLSLCQVNMGPACSRHQTHFGGRSHRGAGMPEGTETKGCEASQVRHPLWPKEPRIVRTPNSRTVVLHWGRFCPLGDILATSRDTFKLSQLGACYWHRVSTGQKCDVAQHLITQPLQQRIIQSIMSPSGTVEKPRFAKSWGH